MINEFRIRNFKRFNDVTLPLNRLTVLTGANGAGKTSLIHALLLVARAQQQARPATVALNDDAGLQLGEGADVLNWNANESEIIFEYRLDSGVGVGLRFGVPDERALHLPLLSSPVGAGEVAELANYVSAERLGPRDTLGASSVSIAELSVGCYGQYVAQVLAVLGHREVSEARRTTSPHGPDEPTLADLLHQTEWWTGRIVRPIELEATWFPNSMVTRLRFKTPGIRSEWTRPPNMGFGVSYALPVIVAGLVAPAGSTLIIENPEAHLHPAGQSEIGRFLARVVADGVQVIVETHSDHVLNGIRHAVADPGHPITAADVKLLFFLAEADPRGVCESLDISPTGAISGWPEGFFDQLDRDLRALTDLARHRGRRP
ncbi:AAA family ATPase [Enhygromyxa salina]|uniref:Recombination protein F n=1 Tax=Enhygromyxa salina TaxID=215803 RepID=A0A2S9YNB7_9BACT|nr:DUF3696 domain-containing protein [Enhygromyxa salina]PRQ06575.1 recombination protein F [Enhygromyxa salina]